jgi:hypothetical protein
MAIALESSAAHLYETRKHWAVRALCFTLGLMVPLGLLWVLIELQQALSINMGGTASAVGIKLWIFGGLAVASHLFLFVAGGRVRKGVAQMRKAWRLRSAKKNREHVLVVWKKSCEQTLLLDHKLCCAIELHNKRNPGNTIDPPHYDTFTADFLLKLKQLGGVPEINRTKPDSSTPQNTPSSGLPDGLAKPQSIQ